MVGGVNGRGHWEGLMGGVNGGRGYWEMCLLLQDLTSCNAVRISRLTTAARREVPLMCQDEGDSHRKTRCPVNSSRCLKRDEMLKVCPGGDLKGVI